MSPIDTESPEELASFHQEILRLAKLPGNFEHLKIHDIKSAESLGDEYLKLLKILKSILGNSKPEEVISIMVEFDRIVEELSKTNTSGTPGRYFLDWIRNAAAPVRNKTLVFQIATIKKPEKLPEVIAQFGAQQVKSRKDFLGC